MEKETNTLRAIEVWAQHVLDGYSQANTAFTQALRNEPPTLLSVIMERACNMQCSHCLFQDEVSSAGISKKNKLGAVIRGLARQMPEGSAFLHSGRIVRPWHLDVMADLRKEHGDLLALGMIDNGSFTSIIKHFERLNLMLDWIDVSVDGDEPSHNKQRNSPKAYTLAREGIRRSRQVARKVTSLMTLSKFNAHTVKSVVAELLESGEVDELHFTPVSPYREPNTPVLMDVADASIAFGQLLQLTSEVTANRVFYRMYRVEDLEMFAHVVGFEQVRNGLENGMIDHGRIIFHVNGVEVSYLPLSIWPQEEILIDADGMYRTAGSAQFTLAQYQAGGAKVSAYNVEQLTEHSSFNAVYQNAVRHWWSFHGKTHLDREVEVIRRIMSYRRP